MKKHLNIQITGEVQGIFFRVEAKAKAKKLDIYGFARNEQDGSVYIEAEGSESLLEKFIEWCYEGPLGAKVEKVEVSESNLKNFVDFKIK